MATKLRIARGTGRSRGLQAGFSLIELMISLVIGLVVVGAVMAAYLASGTSGRNGRALSQITEDASIALNVLRSGISMVGYGKPVGIDNVTARFTKAYVGYGLFGCDTGFADTSKTIDQIACNASGSTDSIAVAYEADNENSVATGAGVPLDCLGNSLTLVAGANPYYLNYSRFYVSDGSLFCRGAGSNTPAALVDNVVDLQVNYGVQKRVQGKADTYRVAHYATAKDMGAVSSSDWTDAVSVRVCVVIRSADNVLDTPTPYQGCDGPKDVAKDDFHLYRAFTSTIVLQNRLGAVL